ncbi:hypothetical protein [Variovorax sp. YR752]|uniref:hypothetical protein n=1 Tax=Variovorax sp. YR752 TaxID=1884383 RepID=UPI003137A8A7
MSTATESTATSDDEHDSLTEEPERPLTTGEQQAIARAGAAPIDVALSSRPFGHPQRYEPRLRTLEPLTRPPLSFAPESISKLDGYEEHGTHVAEAVGALEAMQGVLRTVIDAREKSKLDPTMNESAAVVAVGAYADKLSPPATMKVDAALKVLGGRIKVAEAELRTGIDPSAGHLTAMAGEIRAHCRSLPNVAERSKFINSLIDAGDTESLAAVLRGKPYLSGLTQEQSDLFVQQFNRKRRPELPARIELMKRATAHLERAGAQFVLQMEQAMGTRWDTVKRLRDAKAAASFG